jgi:DNA-directed RNA polymerase specialized sigma24 family protein
MRRIMDTEDLFATISLRMDTAVRTGRLHANSVAQLVAFVAGMSERTILEKSRGFRGVRRLERGAISSASHSHDPVALLEFQRAMELAILALPSDDDRTIARLRMDGANHRIVAELLEINVAAVRQRWKSIRARLAKTFSDWPPK